MENGNPPPGPVSEVVPKSFLQRQQLNKVASNQSKTTRLANKSFLISSSRFFGGLSDISRSLSSSSRLTGSPVAWRMSAAVKSSGDASSAPGRSNMVDAKREEFRKYLEKEGILESLTKALVTLYEEPEKPNDALGYLKNNFAGKLDH